MKILYIAYNGALEPLMQSQCIPYLKGLSERGMDFSLLTFEKTKDKSRIHRLKKELEPCNIMWHPFQYHKRPSLPATLFDMFIGIAAGLYLVVSKRIDIIHARATVPAAMAYVIARLTRKKFIFDLRGLMAEEYIDGGMWKKESFCYRLTLYLQKIFLKGADEVIVLTDNIKRFLSESDYLHRRKKSISVIPCCVDTKRFRKALRPREALVRKYNLSGRFVFLYTGSVGTWYLLREMIDFFIAAKGIIDNAHFLILTHVDKKMAEELCGEKGLSSNEVTIDGVEFGDMPDYINLADVGVFFIKPLFSKRSSCPTKFAEYLACGLPVVINSGIGDTDKIVKEYRLGAVINGFTRESYISGIREIFRLREKDELLSGRCRKAAEDIFSLDRGVSRYLEVYRRLGCG